MLLHLGKDVVIPLRDIIAIIDKKSSFKSEYTQRFFERAAENEHIEHISDKNDVKTYILTDRLERDKNSGKKIRKNIIYTSNISSSTLKKRAGFVDNIMSI